MLPKDKTKLSEMKSIVIRCFGGYWWIPKVVLILLFIFVAWLVKSWIALAIVTVIVMVDSIYDWSIIRNIDDNVDYYNTNFNLTEIKLGSPWSTASRLDVEERNTIECGNIDSIINFNENTEEINDGHVK